MHVPCSLIVRTVIMRKASASFWSPAIVERIASYHPRALLLVIDADVLVGERDVVPARLVAVLHALAAVAIDRILHTVDAGTIEEL